MGPVALNDSVLGYDETTADLELRLLLLNIARRDLGKPVHFTIASSIAASYNWHADAGIGGDGQKQSEGFWSTGFNFNLNAGGSENPTFSIYPVSGEEFTQRLLTPLNENLFNTMMFQDQRIDEILRLLSNGIEVEDPYDGSLVRIIANDPRRADEYIEFRRLAMHLRWLQENRMLFVRSLIFHEPLLENFSDQPGLSYVTDALNYDLSWREQEDGTFTLSRLRTGRLAVTNYDPEKMSDRERFEINEKIKTNPSGFIYLDIDPAYPGGEFPIYGLIKLRSMVQILDFIAAGIWKYPEFDVEKDARTGEVSENPINTLHIIKSETKPPPEVAAINYGGNYYSVNQTDWDLANFRVLAWIFQASVGEIKSPGIPITIAK